jgi:hypothetical protein
MVMMNKALSSTIGFAWNLFLRTRRVSSMMDWEIAISTRLSSPISTNSRGLPRNLKADIQIFESKTTGIYRPRYS